MAYGSDITEGIPYNLSNPVGAVSFSANAEAYDIAINDMAFFLNTSDEFPHSRQTAQYRKQQIDQSNEPGEQSITGWWVRAQSSFHNGSGIKFYDPSAGESVNYRFTDSRGVDVWEKGKVTLLKDTANMSGVTSGVYKLISAVDGATDKVVAWTPANTTIKNYTASGTAVTYTDVTSIATPLDTAILAVASDGTSLFIADNDHIYTGPISTPTAGYSRYYNTGSQKVTLGWVKQRLVACIGASVYELTNAKGTTHSLPHTPVYTHPNADWTWSSISEGGSAIYAAGYAGTTSAIYKFALASNGSMPVLTSGVIAAQLPIGEYVNKIESYLGYLVIGTNKGIRVANISDTTGDLTYGPLIIEAENTGYDFAFRDKFIWITGSVGGYAGLYRMDLSNELEDLRFAYATDAYLDGVAGYATSVDFIGSSNQIAFTTSGNNGIAVQSTTTLVPSGYLTTGKIRYGTLESKVFKNLKARIDNTKGSIIIKSVDTTDTEYIIGNFTEGDFTPEVNVSYPTGAQEYLSFKFIMSRSAGTTSMGPIMSGYQLKSLPAVPRQRLIAYPLACYDREKDSFGNQVGHEGAAYEKLSLLETVENIGDTIRIEDFRTGESFLGIIEELQFINRTPTDKRFSGFGGVINITIRTI